MGSRNRVREIRKNARGVNVRALLLRKRERIAIVRRRLNEGTPKLDQNDPKALHWHVVGCIQVLDGDEDALTDDEKKRVRRMRAEWLRLRR